VRRLVRGRACHGITLQDAALRYLIRRPVVATSIPGPRNPTEATSNAQVGVDVIWHAFLADRAPLARDWKPVAVT
jgi:aryl-alcohol dehydrogenase-like predicted oxidoreductase